MESQRISLKIYNHVVTQLKPMAIWVSRMELLSKMMGYMVAQIAGMKHQPLVINYIYFPTL